MSVNTLLEGLQLVPLQERLNLGQDFHVFRLVHVVVPALGVRPDWCFVLHQVQNSFWDFLNVDLLLEAVVCYMSHRDLVNVEVRLPCPHFYVEPESRHFLQQLFERLTIKPVKAQREMRGLAHFQSQIFRVGQVGVFRPWCLERTRHFTCVDIRVPVPLGTHNRLVNPFDPLVRKNLVF
jgi:hypothetical protein